MKTIFCGGLLAFTLLATGCDDPTLNGDEAGTNAGETGNVTSAAEATPGETDSETDDAATP